MRKQYKSEARQHKEGILRLEGERILNRNGDIKLVGEWFERKEKVAFSRGVLDGFIPVRFFCLPLGGGYHVKSTATQNNAWAGVAKNVNAVLEPFLAQLIEMEIDHARSEQPSAKFSRGIKNRD